MKPQSASCFLLDWGNSSKIIKKRSLGIVGFLFAFGFRGLFVRVVFSSFCVCAKQVAGVPAPRVGVVLLGMMLRHCLVLLVVPSLLFQ